MIGSNVNLKEQINNPGTFEGFGMLLKGRAGYKTVIDRKKEPIKCKSCNHELKGIEKFCPECGAKVEIKS